MSGVALALWFSLILVMSLLELFGPSNTDLYTYLAILIPVAVFAAGYVGVAGFRQFVLSLDLRLLTIVQSWRVVGAGFFFCMPITCCRECGRSQGPLATLLWGLLPQFLL